MPIIKTSELTGAALDWAVAKCEGMTDPKPHPMTDTEAEKMSIPFYLWGTVSKKDKNGNWFTTVEKIKVVRHGVDTSLGATSPSISFIGDDGVLCRGAVGMFFKTETEALSAAIYESSDYQWDRGGYSPSTDWAQSGPIIERKKITVQPVVLPDGWMARTQKDNGVYEGPTPLIAAMRCYVASKMGDEIEIPSELTY